MAARTNRARPAGFTLIELLVVIAIIGVLASLLMAAVMRVRLAGNEAKAKSEIRQLEVNINAYRAERHVSHLPAFGGGANGLFRLRPVYNTNPESAANASQQSIEWQYLNTIFPALNPLATGLPTRDMDNNETLIFFLTGGEVTQYSGFANDPSRPFDTSAATAQNRKGKYFDIPHDRIQRNAAGQTTGRYLDPWGTPYLYMAPIDGKQWPTTGQGGVNPFRQQVGTLAKAINESTFQIISAGPNKAFGPGGLYVPGAAPYSEKDPGGDDFSNFRNLKLSATGE
jgi:prepilin-type N-terminal cleavage/methylation domain-containing protein